MRLWLIVLIAVFVLPQGTSAAADHSDVMKFAQTAVARALDYEQGNRESLIDAQDELYA